MPQVFRNYYEGRLVSGVFDADTKVKGAAEARERLHFIGFVNEKSYGDGSFGTSIQYVANPFLFTTPEEAHAAMGGWPLGAPDILNARPKKPSERLLKLAESLSNLTVDESAELSRMLREKWNVEL